MLSIQRMLAPQSKKTNMSIKIAGNELGFSVGDQLNVFQKEDVLLYTKLKEFPGWAFVKEARVFLSQKRPQAQLFQPWAKTNMEGLTHLKVYYTKKGIFIRAFKGDEFNEMFKKD